MVSHVSETSKPHVLLSNVTLVPIASRPARLWRYRLVTPGRNSRTVVGDPPQSPPHVGPKSMTRESTQLPRNEMNVACMWCTKASVFVGFSSNLAAFERIRRQENDLLRPSEAIVGPTEGQGSEVRRDQSAPANGFEALVEQGIV